MKAPALDDLKAYEIDPTRGFLPTRDPLTQLPAGFEAWDEVGGELPRLMLTGRLIDASEALQIRLVNRLADDPFQAAMELAKQLAANSPKAVALTKGLVLADRKRRIREIAPEIDRARLAVTESEEYAEVVQNKPGTGRAR